MIDIILRVNSFLEISFKQFVSLLLEYNMTISYVYYIIRIKYTKSRFPRESPYN